MMAAAERSGGLLRTVKAVAWSFIGLRGRQGHEGDSRHIKPLHLVAVSLAGLFMFVGALIALVHWMVA
jgi:hypothetical protein